MRNASKHRFTIPVPRLKLTLRLDGHTRSLRKWVLMGIAIGLLSGGAALLFLQAIAWISHGVLGVLAGYTAPSLGHPAAVARPWLLVAIPAMGGLVAGTLVWWLAPTAAGIGTDAAIHAFHEGRTISLKTTAVKLVASALTIGSGGTSGREGPIAQVGAGVGSTLSRWLRFSARDQSIALAAGLGAGISAMFKAPLAGAIIAAEVFYREDFEVEALIPTLVASVVGYSVVGFAAGWAPVFHVAIDPYSFGSPWSLGVYAIVGIACGLLARVGIRALHKATQSFGSMVLPLRAGLGGLLVGLLAFASWQVLGVANMLGTGAEWMQAVLDHVNLGTGALVGVLLFGVCALLELAGIALTMGSGGSGGVFGPCLVVGGFIGAAVGGLATRYAPALFPDLAPFAVVGMVAYFAGAAKAPLGTIVMVLEMTGGYGLLGPAMVAVTFSFLLSGHGSVFASQVRNRMASPIHASEWDAVVLHQHTVEDVMHPQPPTIGPDTPCSEALAYLQKSETFTLPVVAGEKLVGIVTLRDLHRLPEADRPVRPVQDVLARQLAVVHRDDDLFKVLATLLSHDLNALPVVSRRNEGQLLGLVTRRDISAVVQKAATRRARAPGTTK